MRTGSAIALFIRFFPFLHEPRVKLAIARVKMYSKLEDVTSQIQTFSRPPIAQTLASRHSRFTVFLLLAVALKLFAGLRSMRCLD